MKRTYIFKIVYIERFYLRIEKKNSILINKIIIKFNKNDN